MKKVGIVGIDLTNLPKLKGKEALLASGNNFGNMLFTNAAYQQIRNAQHIGFNWNIEKVQEQCSSIFIPAANWINTKQDWGFLAELIERTNLPCTIVGLGSQIQNISDVKVVPKGTKRLLSVISERSSALGVRGDFTNDVLNKCGIKNTKVLGCPSIFTFGSVPKVRAIKSDEVIKIGIAPTRYILEKITKINQFDKQRQLYQFAIREASSIYYQSEQYEVQELSRENERNSQQDNLAKNYYGIANQNELTAALLDKGKYHTSLSSWLADVTKDDVYIGTRIHGAIAATLAGTPAVLITHDHRTKELADIMCVPSIDIEKFEISMLFDLPSFLDGFDFEKFSRRTENNFKLLQQFYKANKVVNNLTN